MQSEALAILLRSRKDFFALPAGAVSSQQMMNKAFLAVLDYRKEARGQL